MTTEQNTQTVQIGPFVSAAARHDKETTGGAAVRVLFAPRRKSKTVHFVDIAEIGPDDVDRIVAAAQCERDRLLIQTAWVTGGRISEVLAVNRQSVQRDYLILPNRKNPNKPIKRVFLPGESSLPGALLLHADENNLGKDDPLFFTRYGCDIKPLGRTRAWEIVKAASERADVRVMSNRPSSAGPVGTMVPIWPHVLRHSRARQIMRHTGGNLIMVQEQLGHARPQQTYLRPGDEERRQAMRAIPA